MNIIFNNKRKSTSSLKRIKHPEFKNLIIQFSNNEIISDETRGVVVFDSRNDYFLSMEQYLNIKHKKKLKRICLLLESPHKDEYDCYNKPIRIANGITGENIEKFICEKLRTSNFSKNFDYEIYLMNAIQYQTSCYKILGNNWTHTNRNHVFKLLFDNFNLKEDLLNRIKSLKYDYIINCVTYNLKSMVDAFLNKKNIKIYLKWNHPSCW